MEKIRNVVLITIVLGFMVLGSMDCYKGSYRTGIASMLLGIVNGLLLLGD